MISVFLLLNFSFFSVNTLHGDIENRIKEVTILIEKYPDSLRFYFDRGDLYLQHEQFEEALIDFQLCNGVDINPRHVLLKSSEALLGIGKYNAALEQIDRLIRKEEKHVLALQFKGRILSNMGEFCQASEQFESVILYAEVSYINNYLDASKAMQACDSVNSFKKSIGILNKGLEKLGPLVVLLQEKVNIYQGSQQFDKALEAQNEIIELLNRKETAHYDRALIHLMKSDTASAELSLINAWEELEQLPIKIRGTKAMKELKFNIYSLIMQL
ncbi:MAG: tetratricopeptide (TPR) repeat protein [Saprospiraceae bacterium]|jgi:tetratricopeptide (TPR) repeat protein